MKMISFLMWVLLRNVLSASTERRVHLGFHEIQAEQPEKSEQFLALKILKILNNTINGTNAVKDPDWDGESIQKTKKYDKDYPDDGNPQFEPGPDLEAIAERKVEMAEKELASEKNDLAAAEAREHEEKKELDKEKAEVEEEKAEKQEAKEELEEALQESKQAEKKMEAAKKECSEAKTELKAAKEGAAKAKAEVKEEKTEHKDAKVEAKTDKADHAEAKDIRKEAEEEVKKAEESLKAAEQDVRQIKASSPRVVSAVVWPLLFIFAAVHSLL